MKEHLYKFLESLLLNNAEEARKALAEHLKIKSFSMLKETGFHDLDDDANDEAAHSYADPNRTDSGYDEQTFVLPSSWAQYLQNGYEEHLSPEEIEAADSFMNDHGLMSPYAVSDEEKYTKKHDALRHWPQGARCATYTFHKELDPEKLGFEPQNDADDDMPLHQLGDER